MAGASRCACHEELTVYLEEIRYYLAVDDEVELLRRARAFDKQALALIHDRYYQSIFRYISFRIADLQTAEDLASEVFTRFLSAIKERGTPPNTIRGWLFGAAKIVVKEQYRHQQKMTLADLHESIPGAGQTPEQRLEERMDKMELRDALAKLTPDQQNVLALRFGYGMPIKDIAETINKSEGSVKMTQVRAIAALAKRFTGMGVDEQ